MKAVVWTKYGPPEVLQLREVEKPTPKENEVLIRIRATTVTAGEIALRGLKIPILLRLPARIFLGVRRPKRIKIFGQELAGEIEAVGKDVTRYEVGDQVIAGTGIGLGAYAEYKCLPETGTMALKPANISYEEAAAVPMCGLEAMQLVRKANIQPGQQVLIIGAGGSIGTFAVQLAKYFEAEVTAVDSAGKLEMLRSIGADHVIDYTREKFTKSGQTYDFVIDVPGKSSLARTKRALKQNGTFISYSKGPPQTVRYTRAANLALLRELIEAGKIRTIIDRIYPLERISEAHRYFETGAKKGNLIITVG